MPFLQLYPPKSCYFLSLPAAKRHRFWFIKIAYKLDSTLSPVIDTSERKIGAWPYRLYDRHQFLVYALNAEGLLVLDIIGFLIPKDAFPAPGIDFPCYIVPLTYKAMFTILCSMRSSAERSKASYCQKGLWSVHRDGLASRLHIFTLIHSSLLFDDFLIVNNIEASR